MSILDSGERREFDTGAVRDIKQGVGRCDLLPLEIVYELMEEDPVIENVYKFLQTVETAFLLNAFDEFCRVRQWDLSTALLELSIHFEEGAKKYCENNWKKGIPIHSYIDSAVRHYLKWRRGDDDEPHDRAFLWNVICCIWTCHNKPEMNDIERIVEKDE